MTEADQHAESQSKAGAKSIAIMVACVAIIAAGMAWYLTYDWPGGRRPSVGEFVMFWFRELIVVGAVVAVLIVWAVQKVFGPGKEASKE